MKNYITKECNIKYPNAPRFASQPHSQNESSSNCCKCIAAATAAAAA